MSQSIEIHKIGGLNAYQVGENVKKIREILANNPEMKIVVVTSAPRTDAFNFTDHLQDFVKNLEKNNLTAAEKIFKSIKEFCHKVCQDNKISSGKIVKILSPLHQVMENIRSNNIDYIFHHDGINIVVQNKSNESYLDIFKVGEDFGAHIIHEALNGDANIIEPHVSDNMRGHQPHIPLYERKNIQALIKNFRENFPKYFQKKEIIIVGGYHFSIGSLRGYSDLMQMIVSISLKNIGEIHPIIQKEFSIQSGDPRVINNTINIPYFCFGAGLEAFGTNIGAANKAVMSEAIKLGYQYQISITVVGENGSQTVIGFDKDKSIQAGVLMVSLVPKISLTIYDAYATNNYRREKYINLLLDYGLGIAEQIQGEGNITILFGEENRDKIENKIFRKTLQKLCEEHRSSFNIDQIEMIYFIGNNLQVPGMMHSIIEPLYKKNINILLDLSPNGDYSFSFGCKSGQVDQETLQYLHDHILVKLPLT